jgi:hypothetical protein
MSIQKAESPEYGKHIRATSLRGSGLYSKEVLRRPTIFGVPAVAATNQLMNRQS